LVVGEIVLRSLPRTAGLPQDHNAAPVALLLKWAEGVKVWPVSETESSEIVTYAALQAYTYDADGYGAEERSDDKEEVEVEGMTVKAKRGRTKMLSELAQVAPALWGAGPTM